MTSFHRSYKRWWCNNEPVFYDHRKIRLLRMSLNGIGKQLYKHKWWTQSHESRPSICDSHPPKADKNQTALDDIVFKTRTVYASSNFSPVFEYPQSSAKAGPTCVCFITRVPNVRGHCGNGSALLKSLVRMLCNI